MRGNRCIQRAWILNDEFDLFRISKINPQPVIFSTAGAKQQTKAAFSRMNPLLFQFLQNYAGHYTQGRAFAAVI